MSVSKNNIQNKLQADARRVPHWSLRKLSVGVASVLLGTTFYFGMSNVAHADVVSPGQASDNNAQVTQAGSQSVGLQSNSVNLQAGNSGVGSNAAQNLAGPSAAGVPQSAANSGSAEVPAPSQGANAAGQAAQSTQDVQPAAAMPFVSLFEQPASGASSDVVWDASKDTELQKDVTETIHVVDHNGQATDHLEKVHFTRTKEADGSFSNWTTDGNATMPAFNLPQIKGYTAYDMDGGDAVTPDGKQVRAVHVTGNMDNFKVRVAYRANQIYSQIQFIDDDGNVVATQDINGTEGASVHVGAAHDVLPWGYNFSNVADVNKAITITDGMSAPQIHVKAMMLHVGHQAPIDYSTQFNTPQGDEPYPSGLSDADLNRTIERTINITDANGHTTSVKQTLHAHRDADVNMATYFINYGAWEFDDDKTDWDAYSVDVPAGQDLYIDGVKATSNQVPKVDVTFDTVSVATNVRLVKQDRSVQVIFYDADQAGANPNQEAMDEATVAQTDVTGHVGDPVDFSKIDSASAGLDAGYTPKYPANTVVSVNNNQVIYVPVSAKTITVNHDQPKNPGDAIDGNPDDTYPDGLKDLDLNQTITRTINVTVPNGHGKNQTVTQVAKIHRDATVNVVTGDVTYTDWTTDNTNWADFKPAVIDGYTVSQADVPAVTVKDGQKDQTVNITYTANDQTMHVKYVDGQGTVIADFPVAGKTDQTVATNAKLPAGWVLTSGQSDAPAIFTFRGAHTADIKVVIEHGKMTVSHGSPVKPGAKTPADKEINGAHDADLNQTITRTVNITEPGQKMATTTQTAKLYRDATVDEVTGDVTYGDWSTDATDWIAVNVPTHAGYTTHISNGADSIPAVTVKNGQQSETIAVTYTANAQTGKIVYVDADNKNVEVGHTDLTGNTDQDVTITPKAPAGYDIVSGQNIPATEKATATGIPTVTVKVNHHKRTVNPGDESKPGDKIPGNPNKQPGDGTPKTDVSYETLHRNMTRTINVADPHTGVHPTTVVLHYNRTATIDDVTGEVTYGNWTVVDGSQAGFGAFNIPTVAGYTSEIKSGSAEDLKALTPSQDQITNWSDQTVNIDYVANGQTMHITYVDKDGHPVDGGSFTVTGKTDQTVPTNAKIPTGWVLSQGQTDAPKTITFGGTPTADVTVKIEHGTTHVDHSDPVKSDGKTPTNKTINGAHDNDLNRTVTRTINVHTPDGTVHTEKQTAKIYRDATVDEVTGDVTYGAWSTDATDWVAYTAPAVDGWTADKSVEAATVEENTMNTTIDINYTANDQSVLVTFYDQTGKKVDSQTINGKTGQTVDANSVIPDGWVLYDGQTVPTKITFGAENNNYDFVISHLVAFVPASANISQGDVIKGTNGKTYPAGVSHNDLNKTITRTIHVTNIDGTTTDHVKSVRFVRNAQVDAVTGDVTYGTWSEGATHVFAGFTPQAKDGYTVDSAKSVVVTPTGSNSEVTLVYHVAPKTITVNYVTEAGTTVSSMANVVPDKSGNIKLTAPNGYVLLTDGNTIKAAGAKNQVYNATVKADSHVVTSHDTNLPASVAKDQLIKTVTRKVMITMPNGKTRTVTQRVTFTRTANVTADGHLISYNDWQATGRAQFNKVFLVPRMGYKISVDGVLGSSVNKLAVTPDMADTTIVVSYAKK